MCVQCEGVVSALCECVTGERVSDVWACGECVLAVWVCDECVSDVLVMCGRVVSV